jgi:aspartate aminotransferase
VVPGIAFGNDNTIRISYATSTENITNGLKRIATFVGA